jgi:hypothetical protein
VRRDGETGPKRALIPCIRQPPQRSLCEADSSGALPWRGLWSSGLDAASCVRNDPLRAATPVCATQAKCRSTAAEYASLAAWAI